MQSFLWTSLDGDEISTENGSDETYIVSELKGFSEPPEFNQLSQSAPYQHGSTPLRAFARPRALKFKLNIFGTDLANLEELRRYVGRVLSGMSSAELPNEGTLQITGEDAVDYTISAIPIGCEFATGRPARSALHQTAQIYLQASDPWWRVNPANDEAFAEGETISVSNVGDIAVWPYWTIEGESETPKLEHLGTGQYIEFDNTLDAGWRLEVSHLFGRKSAVAIEIADPTNTENWMPFLTPGSNWWKLSAGSNSVEFTAAVGGDGTFYWDTLLQTIPI